MTNRILTHIIGALAFLAVGLVILEAMSRK